MNILKVAKLWVFSFYYFFHFLYLFADVLLKEDLCHYFFFEYYYGLIIFFNSMLLYPFNKAQLILEDVFATGIRCPDITFTCPVLDLGPAMSIRILGFFEWEIVF